MADITLTDEVIAEKTIPSHIKRASCRIERSGDLNNGDTLRVAFQVQKSGETTWTTFELRTYTPTENIPSGRTLDLVAEMALYERNE